MDMGRKLDELWTFISKNKYWNSIRDSGVNLMTKGISKAGIRDEQGVSPAIAVVIMVIITVSLAAALYMWTPQCRHDEQTPTVGLVYQPHNQNMSFHVDKVDPDAVDILDVSYILLDDRGTAFPGIRGNLVDILNLDPDHPATNVTFYDNDGDEKLSTGDHFWVKHADFGGEAEAGYTLLLKYELTGDKMNARGTLIGQ